MSPSPAPPVTFKAVVLVGGAQKGTRFRPLSLQVPKPLFPVAGVPLIEHHIDQLAQLDGLSEVIVLGFYPSAEFNEFCRRCQTQYRISIRYLEEPDALGTAGGLVHYRDEILRGSPTAVFVLNADVCGDLPIDELARKLESTDKASAILLSTEATRQQSTNYGCLVLDDKTDQVLHFVDKPSSFVSTSISCGVYLFRAELLRRKLGPVEGDATLDGNGGGGAALTLEGDVFPALVAAEELYALRTTRWWSQTKTPAAVLNANRHYLRLYKQRYAARLCTDPRRATIVGDVFIDPSAKVSPTATIGPNVSIGADAVVKDGARIRESIVLAGAVVERNACVLHAVVGWRSLIGEWSRVAGEPTTANPNVAFAQLEQRPLFGDDGRLCPSLTILGSDVVVAPEIAVLNCLVLPDKEIRVSHKNQIIL